MIGITVTGVDESTDLDRLRATIPTDVEVGILLTETPEGRHRYPSMDWIAEAVESLSGRCALHICGRAARESLIAGRYDHLVAHAPRVQVNGKIDAATVDGLCLRLYDTVFITQHTESNDRLDMKVLSGRHSLLVDGSGGRGITPTSWRAPNTWKAVGFAGGLGPETMAEQLPKILAVAQGKAWIDMEGRLRDERDRFDIDHAAAAIAMARKIAGAA